ncbi:proline dehydrogenase [Apiospora saccharicola]|uniref:Proline dehydrogenase n=1 Tax=Apiospora saccharicola TaxID=335842 RepID=A0ABR1UZ87_9PEZI
MGGPMAMPSIRRVSNAASCGLLVTRVMAMHRMTNTMNRSTQRRGVQTSSKRSAPPSAADTLASPTSNLIPPAATEDASTMALKQTPLAVLPLSTVIRTLFTTTVSSSPVLLPPSLAVMGILAHTSNPILNPDKNPILRYFMKKTFYAQFCAGESAPEVRQTISGLKDIGFTGVILGYAKEVVLTKEQQQGLEKSGLPTGEAAEECVRNEVVPWAAGTMETVRLASPGDFVALKFSGAGRQALYALKNRLPPPKELRSAIDAVCDLARERDVPLLFDAEQDAVQRGIDDWTMEYMRKYNTTPGHALVYGTYQAYLKKAPATLADHLAIAGKENFTLGVKLVRGAYLGSDPREIIHDTKEDTDACYDGISEALIRREWNTVLRPTSESAKAETFPLVSLVLGSHNQTSVRRARAIRDEIPAHEGTRELAIAQLQGMADEVSCELVAVKKGDLVRDGGIEKTRAYKYIVWGSTGECMKYLLRRARENRDAVQRTRDGRDAMFGEVVRRVKSAFGFGARA